MNLAPLTNAPLPIQLHAYAAMTAFVLGVVQLAAVKGTTRHRALGYTWAGLMVFIAVSSFWIHDLRVWGPWSPIHLLSIFTLTAVPVGIWHAHRHAVQRHRFSMIGIFSGALVIAGLFTFVPGRIMYKTLFGG
jgi:uncharacterized membrane protein